MQHSVSLTGEDHTLGNLLRESLVQDRLRVDMATYNPNPSSLRVYAKPGKNPKRLLLDHVGCLEKQAMLLEQDLIKQTKAWPRSRQI